jgi:AcrR family transcriptional regulator
MVVATATPATVTGGGRAVDEEAVLDAAEASLLAVGVRRTTLTEVARRAGVSRMSLYRRWPDLRSLVGDVMTREWTRVVTAAAGTVAAGGAAAAAGIPAGSLADRIVATALEFRANPLFRKIVETDPELLVPYVLDRRGATQQLIVELLQGQLADGQANGTVRAGDPAAQARMVLLTVQSFVLSAGALGAGVPLDLLTAELRRMLAGYLDVTSADIRRSR